MDLGTSLTGLFIALFLLVCLLFIRRYKRKKQNILLQSIQQLNQHNQSSLGKIEYSGNFAIAFAADNKELYFVKNTPFSKVKKSIQLSEIKSCQLQVIRDPENAKNFKSIKLIFENKKRDKSNPELSLYNNEESFQLYDELILGKRWESKVNSHLSV